MSKILIVGGAGYIGSINVRLFLDRGYEVVVVDNLNTGHISSVDKRAKFIKLDIRNKKELTKILIEEKIDAVVEMLKEYFVSLFYSERVQTFTFRFLENNFYDPYMIEFLIRNEIINFNGDEYVYIGHQTRLSPMFPLEYKKTLFYALEKRDKNNIRYYKTKAMGCAIKAHMTTFYSRPETYFELNYDPITKDWGIIPTFFDECIDHIESGELFDIDDGNFYAYNIIIKYFNDMDINVTDLELIERFDLKQHHMLFYIIPSIIFCLNKQLDDLMQKE